MIEMEFSNAAVLAAQWGLLRGADAVGWRTVTKGQRLIDAVIVLGEKKRRLPRGAGEGAR